MKARTLLVPVAALALLSGCTMGGGAPAAVVLDPDAEVTGRITVWSWDVARHLRVGIEHDLGRGAAAHRAAGEEGECRDRHEEGARFHVTPLSSVFCIQYTP